MAIRAEKLPALPHLDPSLEVPEGLRIAYAKHLLNDHLLEMYTAVQDGVGDADTLPTKRFGRPSPPDGAGDPLSQISDYDGRVAIVGAGATGLYLAMMFKYLKISNVDIYEASDRIGGRCYTYNFSEDQDCPHNYYDIGAMRIPHIPAMKSTLNLLKNIGIKPEKYTLDAGCEPQMHWYSHTLTPDGKPFEDRIAKIINGFGTNWNGEFKKMVDSDDNYSTRAWLMFTKPKLTYDVTEEAESAETSTGLFDQAFIESLCDYSDFQAAKGKDWSRVDGGMSVLTDEMNKRIEDTKWPSHNPISIKVKTNTPVIAMNDNSKKIEVTVSENKKTHTEKYDMVFNTTAMGPLQRMDIQGLVKGFGFPKSQKNILTGIRALSYDRACKVAIKFKTRWWKGMYENTKAKSKIGGVSSTDLCISNVVYPSWNDGDDKPNVLMVSYSWAQDATRMGSLIPDYSKQKPTIDDTVVTQCFQDLAKLWSQNEHPKITTEFLREQYVAHHAYAWSHDPYTGGAFTLFGPGQFKYIYPEFQHVLCGGKFAICGEALSPHHAWISGALDSAYLTMLRWLRHNDDYDRIEALEQSWFGEGEGKHTAEFDDTLMYWSVKLSKNAADKQGMETV
ncbi:hypothetical protein FSARC_14313 [Fusarium sarcochroum]|uniref:Amine oxidase domain-containing protein n=1 Tax=Fusarium sarcochroum TaxID=1208366 RepID=A0A8H4SUH7_9HYPO|nr:hypothetical protein FSARC_14313 [Fusarium sarcochroum]